MNSVELKCYPFTAFLDKFSGSCNSANDVSTETCVTNRTKVFIIIARLNEAKTMVKDISCDGKCKYNNTSSNSNQKWINKTRQW